MKLNKKWIYKKHDEEIVQKLQEKYNIPKLTACILQNRLSIIGKKQSKNLMERMYDSMLLKDMEKAVSRINYAIDNNEHVTVYGDYDADGVTSTAILYMYLNEKGAKVDFYIPDRAEGYGVNIGALEKIKNSGTKLIITVDTGVTAVDEVSYAQNLGMDVIVTDHHECKSEVPSCCAVINPKQNDCDYPFKELAGVGVAFKLITAVDGGKNTVELAEKYMPLVCLGTIADVAPLIDENRTLVSIGLKNFSSSCNEGIDALLEATNLNGKKITAGNIGYIIAPRINAAGRLGSAQKSVELFLCKDSCRAFEIASELSDENKLRQNVEQQIFDEAIEMIENGRLYDKNVIVIAKKGWHTGVIGIVSSKITERYYRPSILISVNGNEGKGSGRSISSFNLFEALTYSSDLLLKFGGHSLAAGLTLSTGCIEAFSDKINEYSEKMLTSDDFVPSIHIDAKIDNDCVTLSDVSKLKALEPYGMGNPTPVFAYTNAKIKRISTLSEGKHLKIDVVKDCRQLEAIGFNFGYLAEDIRINDIVDIAGILDINCYRDIQKIQLIIKDIKLNIGR